MVLGVALALLVGHASAASADEARQAKAIMQDGRVLEGRLVLQNERVVVLDIAGIETTLDRGDVADLQTQQTPQELYDRIRPTLKDSDLAGRLDLTRELTRRNAFALARRELSDLARLFPGEPAIVRLDTQITAKEELAKQRVAVDDRPRNTQQSGGTRGNDRTRPEESDLLNEQQINLMRVYEIDLTTEPRGITIDRETLDKFFSIYRDGNNRPLDVRGQREFRRQPGYEQLDAIFATRDRSLYDGVKISLDPPSLATYRSRVNGPYVLDYFITHFGPDAEGTGPKLPLVRGRRNGVAEAYTNLYVLNAYEDGLGVPMIDRINPAESLLLQWGLPRERATHPAPEGVEGWEPAFRSVDDARFQTLVDWIRSLFPNPPDKYGFTFEPGQTDGEAGEAAPADQDPNADAQAPDS
jgi:hypothetical protein